MNKGAQDSGHNIYSNNLYQNDFPRNQGGGEVAPKYFAMGDIKQELTSQPKKKEAQTQQGPTKESALYNTIQEPEKIK